MTNEPNQQRSGQNESEQSNQEHRQETLLMTGKVSHLILMLDGDEPGREAQAELSPRLARHFFTKVVELPEGNQPDTTDEKLIKETLVQVVS